MVDKFEYQKKCDVNVCKQKISLNAARDFRAFRLLDCVIIHNNNVDALPW